MSTDSGESDPLDPNWTIDRSDEAKGLKLFPLKPHAAGVLRYEVRVDGRVKGEVLGNVYSLQWVCTTKPNLLGVSRQLGAAHTRELAIQGLLDCTNKKEG